MEIVLVTGNKNKLKEFQSIIDENYKGIILKSEKIDLEEIQSLSLEDICEYKAKKAYEILKKPIIVEDTGFFLDELKGLPGPFIKFFQEKLGEGALIKLLGNSQNRQGYSKTVICFYDGEKMIFSEGRVDGIIGQEISKGEGFGFDFCFIPSGYDKTFSELGEDIKNKISHRKFAIKNFLEKFKDLKI